VAAEGVFFLFIISINGTIQRVFHEARERNRALIPYLTEDFFNELLQVPRMVRI
jgi:hypothetical protein